mmetsp:Transcript_23430/g.65399  ORF Transcript_23430/g.65399 Transcript_23430/m.65399 type:complete len:102 (+) Transcript_23430:3-308(+)
MNDLEELDFEYQLRSGIAVTEDAATPDKEVVTELQHDVVRVVKLRNSGRKHRTKAILIMAGVVILSVTGLMWMTRVIAYVTSSGVESTTTKAAAAAVGGGE